MKQFDKAISMLAVVCGLASCTLNKEDEQPVPGTGTVRFIVSADAPVTKVTFNGEALVWEGDESIGLLLGNEASTSADPASRSTQRLSTATTPGVFSGDVTLGSFTTADIKGIVYPYSQDHFYRRNVSSDRIVMTVATAPQIQQRNNVLVGANAPLFCPLTYSDIINSGDTYTVEGKQFQWGCALVRFNIYGNNSAMAADEVFKSVLLHSTASTKISGTSEWAVESSVLKFNGVTYDPSVSLVEEVTIKDKTSENGVKVFMALLPRGEFSFTDGSYILVTTDRAEYVMPISTTINLVAGEVRKIGLDLANFTVRRDSAPNTLPSTSWVEEVEW